jgi:hypothetical protein
MVITQHLGEPLRLAQNVENPIEIAKGNERTVKIEPKIDRPGNSLGALGEIGEGFECLFHTSHGFARRAAGGRLEARLIEIGHGLCPQLPIDRMVSKPVDLPGQSAWAPR